MEQSEFFIAPTQMNCDSDLDGKVIGTVERLGVTIAYVKDRRALIRPVATAARERARLRSATADEIGVAAGATDPLGVLCRRCACTRNSPTPPPHMIRISVMRDHEMQAKAAVQFDQHEIAGERQEHAETENLQRIASRTGSADAARATAIRASPSARSVS